MKSIVVTTLCLGLYLAGAAADDKPPAQAAPIAVEWNGKVTDAAQLPVEPNDWGTLQWVCNGKLMPGAQQTVGLATILPGKQNPVHYHPNCEEVLYVLSGQGVQSYDGRTIELKAGMTIRIPAKVKHNLVNTGTEPLRTVVSFSSGDRQTVWVSTSHVFQLRLVEDNPSDNSEQMVLVTNRGERAYTNVLNVQKSILLDEAALNSAQASKDTLGHPLIQITLTDQGAKHFTEVTRQNIGRRLAIVIAGKLYEAPVIKTEISGGKAQISGAFTQREAKDLAGKIESALARR